MKKLLLTLTLLATLALNATAIPAKPGLWRTLRLTDGTQVKAQLCGDEHRHFWMAEDGTTLVAIGDRYKRITEQELQARPLKRMPQLRNMRHLGGPRRAATGERTHYTGKKKGIVILVQFSDTRFKNLNDNARYQRIMNEENYSAGNFRGSVYDYFKEQSHGQFELTFDVVGPYTLTKKASYYGQNDDDGNDMFAEQMIKEACQAADDDANFADYDWDGDGEADQVFVLYAGKGEADGGDEDTVWPHMFTLEDGLGGSLELDNTIINTYACSNEVDAYGNIEGIGCFCHEFSHCMGFPDFYDTSYSGWFGMSSFDLMCSGSYNGNTFCPCGYTAHEKMMCGWQEPVVLGSEDVTVDNLLPLSQYGDTYIIYNEAYPDEYYMLENRQKDGWDTAYPATGLMITHVDFDKQVWENNIPNTKVTTADMRDYGYTTTNNHQRMTIFHADNNDDEKYWNQRQGYYTRTTLTGDLYPYNTNSELTPTSTPAATLYNANKQGKKFMTCGITDIRQNDDGTISFKYIAKSESENNTDPDDPEPVKPAGDYLFYESFDQCQGKGGNDDLWNGSLGSGALVPDNEGWITLSDKAFSANQCARFGTGSVIGITTSPTFTIDGSATLTFKAAAWDANADGTSLGVTAANATLSQNEFTMNKGSWTECKATITGQGKTTLLFKPSQRFFLDEVLVVDDKVANGISQNPSTTNAPEHICTIDGRYVGTDRTMLQRGFYIVNGKKIVVK